jgi:hypothetical protein
MLRRIKDIHRPLAANSALHNDRQVLPDCLRHRDEDAGVVQVFLVLWPADAFLVAFLRTGAFLEGKSGEEEQKACEEDEADAAGVQCCVGAAVGGEGAVACGRDGYDVDCWGCC